MGTKDLYCRSCGCIMRLKEGKYGKFCRCSGFPRCFNTYGERDGEIEAETQYTVPDWAADDPAKDND